MGITKYSHDIHTRCIRPSYESQDLHARDCHTYALRQLEAIRDSGLPISKAKRMLAPRCNAPPTRLCVARFRTPRSCLIPQRIWAVAPRAPWANLWDDRSHVPACLQRTHQRLAYIYPTRSSSHRESWNNRSAGTGATTAGSWARRSTIMASIKNWREN
eukprot:7312743-Pyramimonas_sp.AAC.1